MKERVTRPRYAGYDAVVSSADDLLAEVLNLPAEARARMVRVLIDSLDAGEEEGVEDAWAAEIERRVEELDSGRAKLVDWETVRAELRRAVQNAR